MMTIQINKDGIRDKLLEYLLKRGIDSRQMIFPISHARHFKEVNNGATFPVSESISLNSLHLPSSTQLSIKQIKDISQVVLKGLKHCG
jgi:dTDP-4-amino-4,6-dideoxygalactose transaminase